MESEFIALDKTGEEAEWLQNFLEDIPYWSKPVAPAYPSHDKFINKKIDMFDKISLMYGSDRARGDCVELFGDINVDCNSEQRNDDIEGSSTERDVQDIVSETSLSQGNPQKKSFFEYSRYGR
ncbi:hypothetical protein T459_12204 [Capsicum annuum]|uniref:Uncharacterized protein n=1 Tax=Capsicum annuum TaxID=4072 RepID=A0A2G2ZP84_CAPAN|nr:hypothetical protein T459_12204 [Capsicum annuum]